MRVTWSRRSIDFELFSRQGIYEVIGNERLEIKLIVVCVPNIGFDMTNVSDMTFNISITY